MDGEKIVLIDKLTQDELSYIQLHGSLVEFEKKKKVIVFERERERETVKADQINF